MMPGMLTMRPQASEYADYYARYIGRVPDGQWRARLEAQADEYRALVAGLDEDTAGLPTAPGKWSVTQTLLHVAMTRQATLSLLKSVPDEFADRKGVASDNPITVRALAWIIVGHAQHHLDLLRDALDEQA